jgi:hypothetical protein
LALIVGAGLLGAPGSGMLAPALAAEGATQAAVTQAAVTQPAVTEAAVTGAAVTPSSGTLNAVLPQRILNTRTTTGGHHAKLGSAATMRLAVLDQGGVPGAGVSAVLLNVTALDETARTGYLTVFPTGISRPLASTLDYRAGVAISNLALVPVGSDGTVSIFNSAGQADVAADVEGWVGGGTAAASGQTTTMKPARILDTRTTTGGHRGSLGSGQSLKLAVEGAGGIPVAGVSAVYADIVAVPVGNAAGNLTAYPSDAASPPLSSTVNFMTGVTTANLVVLPVSATGTITVTNHSPRANVIVDVAGWISGGYVTADAGTRAVPVTRILDTRTSLGGHHASVGGNAAVSEKVLGVGGVPPAGVAAVVVHVTGVKPTAPTYLTAFAAGYPRPAGSTLNLGAGNTVSNTAIVPVGPAGAVTVYNHSGSLNVVLDVQGWIASPVLTVVPPLPSALSAGPLTSSDGKRARSILTNANRYAMTTWWKDVYPSLVAAPMRTGVVPGPGEVPSLMYSAASVNATDSVRRLSMEAFSLATSIGTGAYNPAAAPAGTGVPTATAASRTIQIISQVVAGHLTERPGGWGATSESMFCAAYLGTAAWLLWPRLSTQLRSEVAKMVYFEAEWGMDERIQFYANAAGKVLQPGDTGADQDSWYPMADQLAVVMMPGNAHLPFWENTVVRDALVAWSRPSDDRNATIVNGASVASWIGGRGSNVRSTGDLINHNRYAPDYSTLIYQNMQDVLLSSLAGQPAPRAATALVAPVYAAYTTVKYASPPNLKPGGPVYRPGSPAIYYPQGCDWGTGQEIPYALVDAETAAFGVGTKTSAAYEGLHADVELALQRQHADGHSYTTDAQYVYVGREEHVAQQAGQLYLTKFVRDHALSRFSNSSQWLAP